MGLFFGTSKVSLNHCALFACLLGSVSLVACTASGADGNKPATSDTIATAPAQAHPSIWPSVKWPLPDSQKLDQRVKKIMGAMTLEEKVGQTIQADIHSVTPDQVRKYHLGAVLAGGDSGPNGQRWGTPQEWLKLADKLYYASTDTSDGGAGIPILFGIDAVHGDNRMLGATIFPQHSALGATHDPELIGKIAQATAEEVRASGINWAFAPTLAVPRDDRWGRAYEGYSENPELVARYAKAAVLGLQGKPGTPAFLDGSHVLATAKHFIGDGATTDGKDQGNAQVSETRLRDIAGAGYPPAIAAGVQTIMATFSSWNGVKVTGNKSLLTGVLKKRMNFGGFIVGDWNAHGQIPGCTNTDCPQALNAGLDMYMAPDSWKGLYENTLAEVKSGKIPMQRLNDAVSRILRVKLRLGLFDMGAPSTQPLGGKFDVIGSPEHLQIARRAVRESLVLLKNQDHLLPLDPHQHILVTGEGADSIPMQSGGWTLTWQGTGTTNADFPNGVTIWDGIRKQVKAAGGSAELSADGTYKSKPDVAIVVYGEHPYAEFHGDIPNLLFSPGDKHDLKLIKHLRDQGIPVVSVFLTGRPLWVNPLINASNAFVVAWLPGTQGEGVADVLLRSAAGKVQYDFHGKLAFSWPRTATQYQLNVGQKNYDPLFPYGYGLTYADDGDLRQLPEASGIKGATVVPGKYLEHGKPDTGVQWQLTGAKGVTTSVDSVPAKAADGSISMHPVSYKRQEDARRIDWSGNGKAGVALHVASPQDLSRQTNGNVMLVATLKVDTAKSAQLQIGMRCGDQCGASIPLASLPEDQWLRVGIPLKCFSHAGVDMVHVTEPFRLQAASGSVSVNRVVLGMEADKTLACPTQ
ncbi:MAG TPA: glycoside hydrolase family 3 N-terminal domain-containing protein [Oleiagrimonas sp.]|nr:glycoside hydrolase family 3 N-terminal domain-containing protein [Oleiagrimonas sp.]